MGVVGIVYVLLQPKYLAKGIVFVRQESFIAELTSVRDVGISWNTPAQDFAGEFMDLLQTDSFARAITENTDLESALDQGPQALKDTLDVIRESVWAVSLGQNQVYIGATHKDPQVTVQLVNAAVNNFIEWKTNSDRLESETALTFFQDLSATYKNEYDLAREDLVNYLIAHPEPLRGDRPDREVLEIDQLQSKLRTAEERYIRALDNIENARLALVQIESNANQTYIVIDAPVLPDKPEFSRKEMALTWAVFLVVGGFLSLIGIGGSALLNRSFMFPVDVVNLTGLPVFASFPKAALIETAPSKKHPLKVSKKGRNRIQPVGVSSPNGNTDEVTSEKSVA
jgi:hypothetical protein